MSGLAYKWYLHLRAQGYGRCTSFYCAIYNAHISAPYWTKENGFDVPRRWIDNRPKRPAEL